MAEAGVRLDILGRVNPGLMGSDYSVSYPQQTRIRRVRASLGPSWLCFGIFLIEVLRRADHNADLFLGYDMHGFLAAHLLATLHRRPVIYHCHDYTPLDTAMTFGARCVKAFEARYAGSADLVIVPDRERGDVMRRELQLNGPPLTVANAPVHRYESSGNALSEALVAQGKSFSRIVLRQGRIGPGHGIEATLRSIPLWGNKQWGFAVMGPGESEYVHSLVALAEALGVSQQFAVLPLVSYDKIPLHTPGADIGHALYEPIHINNVYITTASNKLMEYMAAGLPVLVSDRPGLRALVETRGCGVSADESSPESIAAAVNALLSDPDLSRRLGAAGARAFEEEYSYERQFAPVLEVFRSLCCTPVRS